MENKKITDMKLLRGQVMLANAIKGLQDFIDDKFTSLNDITIDDLDGLNGLVSCIKLASIEQTDNTIEFLDKG
ncbi:hypothetical protein [Vagococcus hydrophili]|uniref:Uncharacterized protein n=1 Tax=Vagococcus hydrophili TaxID=2714947 RepID=A0A6G8ARD7_9ENTE|nr:hypothetical protein [Vagococcus hydrophili]QIL47557.1 hypothetical protein G7082_02900 [Vagococcus hydrophili]